MLIVQLIENVLDLSLELLINGAHLALECLRHSKLFSLLSELPSGENGVQGTVDVGPDLEIVVLYELVENLK